MTIAELIEHLKTYQQDAEVSYASVTAETNDNVFVFVSWDTVHGDED